MARQTVPFIDGFHYTAEQERDFYWVFAHKNGHSWKIGCAATQERAEQEAKRTAGRYSWARNSYTVHVGRNPEAPVLATY